MSKEAKNIFDELSKRRAKGNIDPELEYLLEEASRFFHIGVQYENEGEKYKARFAFEQAERAISVYEEVEGLNKGSSTYF